MLMPGCPQPYETRSPGEAGQSWKVQRHRQGLPTQHEGEPLWLAHTVALIPVALLATLGQRSVGQEPVKLQDPSQKVDRGTRGSLFPFFFPRRGG